jgi:hypothetical protein
VREKGEKGGRQEEVGKGVAFSHLHSFHVDPRWIADDGKETRVC